MRAQVSLEFIIIFSVAVMVMATLFIVGAARLESSAEERHRQELRDIALTVQQELVTAAGVHDGYERSFTLPQDIAGKPYSFSVQNASAAAVLTVQWKELRQSVRVPKHNGTLYSGKNTIRKENGTVRCNT